MRTHDKLGVAAGIRKVAQASAVVDGWEVWASGALAVPHSVVCVRNFVQHFGYCALDVQASACLESSRAFLRETVLSQNDRQTAPVQLETEIGHVETCRPSVWEQRDDSLADFPSSCDKLLQPSGEHGVADSLRSLFLNARALEVDSATDVRSFHFHNTVGSHLAPDLNLRSVDHACCSVSRHVPEHLSEVVAEVVEALKPPTLTRNCQIGRAHV